MLDIIMEVHPVIVLSKMKWAYKAYIIIPKERKETSKKVKETAYSIVYRSSQWKFPSFRLYWFKLQLIRNNKSAAF
jgi:hypothetical protein